MAGDEQQVERDRIVLLRCEGRASAGVRLPPADERRAAFARVSAMWPAEPSAVLRVGAKANSLDEDFDERFGAAPAQLRAWSTRQSWAPGTSEDPTLRLASLMLLDRLDYVAFIDAKDTPMSLRDGLSDPDDLAAISAAVRWESVLRRHLVLPDVLLRSWSTHVASIARDWTSWDSSEYANTLDIRSHLQHHASLLSWRGQEQWRQHVEPVDDAFRACTERRDVPVTLSHDLRPGGWWTYRVPVGAPRRLVVHRLDCDKFFPGPRPHSLSTFSEVWRLAERPDGLRSLSSPELEAWGSFCDRQAQHEQASGSPRPQWSSRHQLVLDERRRRSR